MMSKDFESLLEYKKSTKDWHYNPSVPSVDYQYVGRFVDLTFDENELPEKETSKTSASYIWPEDIKNGTLIPSQLSPNSLAASKLDIKRWGYHEGNTAHTQYIEFKQDDDPSDEKPDDLPQKFYEIRDFCNMDYSMVAVLKQEPGNFTGWHFDTYHSVATKGNLTEEQKKDIKRYWIPLEDWHWGHFIQVGNSVLTHWKAGEIYTWNYGMYHLGANAGIKTRWSCQVTGYSTEESLHNLNEFEFKLRG